ncbi:MAG: hypothetical protein LIO95_07375 [Clostridiales bacterium]|nr:hypothetical protein [Clostridiales bacterium]
MTDAELDALPRITTRAAVEYLQGEMSLLTLRYRAQRGRCPFCTAEKRGQRWDYRINGALLKRFKAGEFHDSTTQGR